MLLRPFGYKEAAEFHPHWSHLSQAAVYFICGGLPFSLRCFSPELSIEQNLAAVVFDELGLLFREPEFLLREELRELATYNAILLAMASGNPTNTEIAKMTGIGDRALHYSLSALVELGYVQRRFPLTGAPPTARQVRYTLEDPLLRFWFRFVYPNLSLITRLGAARAVRELVLSEWDSYFGHGFERLRLDRFPNPRQATLGLRFFTRHRLRVNSDPAWHEHWHSLDELYELD